MTPQIEIADGTTTLRGDVGFVRMLLTGALSDATLWQRAQGIAQDTKNRWVARGNAVRALLDALPAPVNPRNPFDDIADELTPEEADARWRERAAAEDQRRAARERPVAPVNDLPDDILGLLG